MKRKHTFADNPVVRAVGLQRVVVILVIILLAVFFSIGSPIFRQYSTLVSIFDYSYYISFMAIGVTFALITGGNDLSIGTGMICYGLIGGYLVSDFDMPVWVGILATVLVGVLAGLVNGLIVAVMEVPPFIATLSMMMVVRGLGSLATGGMSISWPQASTEQGWFRNIFKLRLNTTMIPIGFLWVLICVILMTILLNKTRIGRYIIAIGSNKEAARLSGIKVVRYHIIAYVLCGFFTGLAGVAYSATFSAIAPGSGAGLELDAIGAAIIGGTSMTGGSGSVVGTLLGVFVMSLLKTGLPYIGLQANWQQIITGIVLFLAVFIDIAKNKKLA